MADISFPLILIGPTGAGKTTVGRLLATKLNVPFLDLDEEIEARCGADIPWVFDVEGEVGFRDREARIFAEFVDKGAVVVSTGAGVVLRGENQELLKRHQSHVIWLQADLKTQFDRLKNDKNRPLLQVADPKAKLRAMATEREPLYRGYSSIQVQTRRTNPSVVVRQIMEQIERQIDENA
ncbi:MAG: shikimate kinase [Gammaproteobacteria bacterium]|nr:shikimate kinase [Gammaproteobacteria bacterium]OUX77618.1 MAG: shikimate kinase [Oceanospirillales bacterium TMED59]